MMRFLILLSVCFCYAITDAQYTANDTAFTGKLGAQSTFYQLSTKTKTTVNYNDWHLAISIRATEFPYSPLGGTTMRINEPFGVTAYYVPNSSSAEFNAIDTTNYQNWARLHDSDTALDEGALNANRDRANIFDFGWGVYNSATHNVVGDSVYLIKLPNGDVKKFTVVVLQRDTAFDIKYANIDNSNLQLIHISKKDYQGKQFVYLNMQNNEVTDKEPVGTNWDLQFLRYEATDIIQGKNIPVVGVWLNKGIQAAVRRNQPVNSNDYNTLTFSTKMNTIGWNWKSLINTLSLESGKTEEDNLDTYLVDDSTTYFIKTRNGDYYKLVFTGYDARNGVIGFYTENLSATAINEPGNIQTVTTRLFPNPTAGELNVYTENLPATLRIMDLGGRIINELPATDKLTQLSTDNLANGIYLLQVNHNGASSVNRFVVSK